MSIDCSKKELNKFGDKCSSWMEKSLENGDGDRKMIWASLRPVLDTDWVKISSRDHKISEKLFSDIFKVMQASYLERNSSIIQMLADLRITKPKEEQLSDCLHRIVESYRSAQLDLAPLTTRLPGDALSEKVKEYLIEKMRLTLNIQTLEEVFAYMQS